jgi:hypothetical protein
LDNAKIAEVFDRQAKYLDQLQGEELRAVVARDEAQRDQQLALFLAGNSREDGLSLLAADIRFMSIQLYGAAGGKDPDEDPSHPLWRRLDEAASARDRDTGIRDGYERAVREYQESGGKKPTDCEMARLAEVGGGEPGRGESGEQAELYQRVLRRCQQLAQIEALAGDDTGTAEPVSPEMSAVAFNYTEARKAVVGMEAALQAQRDDAKKLAAALDEKQRALSQAFESGKTSRDEFDQALQNIHDTLSSAQTVTGNPYLRKVVSAKLSEDIQNIVDATAPQDPSCKSGGAAAGSGSGCPALSVVRASLGVFQAVTSVGDAFSDPPRIPHPNVLAVASAQMSYSRDVANAEIALEEAQIEAARRKLDAFTTALYMLSHAREELRKVHVKLGTEQGVAHLLANSKPTSDEARHVKAAVYYYVRAWNAGQTVADEIGVEQRITLRRAALTGSRRAAQEWVDTIKPGVDTLAQYGAGGIDPKTVAQILGALGLVATGVGVNR